MVQRWGWLAIVLLVAACGKNDPIIPYGSYPYAPIPNQAPPPPGYRPPTGYPSGGGGYPTGGGYPVNGGYPGGGGFPMGGGFRPQMPPNYPPAYTPFLPIDNFMRQNPQLQAYWGQFWMNWQIYAQRQRINPYDFNRFWFDYCPEQWNGGSLQNLYGYFEQNFYYWVQPGMQFGGFSGDPGAFWQNCDYYPYPQYLMSCEWCY